VEGASAFSDSIYIPHSWQQLHSIQQSERNDPVRDLNLSEQQTERLGSTMHQWELLAEGTEFPYVETEVRDYQFL
jgi:hypothetical protein